ncbi:cell cycle checkpoint control protein rad9a [Dinochytrium kinnereticum]|nr:cell cycle checkpoint control protein rad9a [Dinochytrium kinnereticum]
MSEILLSAAGVRAFAKFVNILNKFGEEITLSIDTHKFFESYKVAADAGEEEKCMKVLGRAVGSVFKLKGSLENVESVKISLQSLERDRLVVESFCRFGVKRTHCLQYESGDSAQAIYSKDDCPHKIIAAPKLLLEWIACFSNKLEEITLRFSQADVKFRSFSEFNAFPSEDQRGLETEITIDREEFDFYSVSSETELSFSFKDFKTILGFADVTALNLIVHFAEAGSPLIFTMQQDGFYFADFVLASVARGPTHRNPQSSQPSTIRPSPVMDNSHRASQASSAAAPNPWDPTPQERMGAENLVSHSIPPSLAGEEEEEEVPPSPPSQRRVAGFRSHSENHIVTAPFSAAPSSGRNNIMNVDT